MAFYKSYGAAGEVTGSCHFLQIGKTKILIDCGMFQGDEEEFNKEPFDFNPKEIDYLIVTHAHLDHIGRIPLLVKEGFTGKIISTRATFSITQLMLKNSAGILETKKEPLYTTKDVDPALHLFGTFLEPNKSLELTKNIKISFKNAGHILGAVSVRIKFFDEGITKTVVFSGDIGQSKRIITSPVKYWKKANYVFIESTYGHSIHQNLNVSIKEFKKEILETIKKGGTVVIPSFALERTQEILFLLKQLSQKGKLQDIPVYLDSPLAINVTKTFKNYPKLFNNKVTKMIKANEDPFDFVELIQTYTKESSQKIESHKGAKIIIAGSGMCQGGRVSYHLIKYLQDKKNLVLFVGFQVHSTTGSQILNAKHEAHILGMKIPVQAKISSVSGFSAHADQHELLEWLNHIKDVNCVYLVHGDIPQLKVLKEKVKTKLQDKVHIVKMHEQIHL
ncbi:MAG: MBL fold metallo-hydrolase [Arcobacteraceae bacterium]|nr:MBL fold metallo-hydrolase [Arcobacteraceae bacterium]